VVRRARGAFGLAALLLAAGACSTILGLDEVDFDGDDADGTVVPHCDNDELDDDESAVDCGGSCAGCRAGETCGQDSDCISGECDGVCGASCSDGDQNGDETGVDCGGSCPICPGSEDCGKRGDEDGNRLADCADPVCWDTQCVPIPDDWLGPVTLVAASAEPGCPEDWSTAVGEGFTGLSAPSAECGECTCGQPVGGTCGDVLVELFESTSCNGQPTEVVVASAQCEEIDDLGIDSVRVPVVPGMPGPCPPNGGALTAPDPQWNDAVRVCMGVALGACGAGSCTTPPPAGGQVCVLQSGDHPCPEPWSDRRPLYVPGGEVDTRSCSPCSCAAPMDGECTAEISLYTSFPCTFIAGQLTSGQCGNINGPNPESVDLESISPPSGTCAPAGGNPMGTVVPGDAETTVCCLPPRRTAP
jgi:hypothetical protein